MINKDSKDVYSFAKAIIYEGLGGSEVIKVVQKKIRFPKTNEVRIQVKAAGINPTDVMLRTVDNPMVKFPVTPGADAAGIIEAIGPGVTRFKVGDRVMAVLTAFRSDGGAQSSLIVVPVASVVLMPEGSNYSESAGLPMNGLTAIKALDLARLKRGSILAVTGGAGVLAHYIITIAKRRGITVIADAKSSEKELVYNYGADFVVKRGHDFANLILKEFPNGVDALIDTAVLAEKCFPAIRDYGTYVAVRRLGNLPEVRSIFKELVWVPEVLQNTEGLELLRKMVESGEIKLLVAGEYKPEQVYEAQMILVAGGLRGRPVIVF